MDFSTHAVLIDPSLLALIASYSAPVNHVAELLHYDDEMKTQLVDNVSKILRQLFKRVVQINDYFFTEEVLTSLGNHWYDDDDDDDDDDLPTLKWEDLDYEILFKENVHSLFYHLFKGGLDINLPSLSDVITTIPIINLSVVDTLMSVEVKLMVHAMKRLLPTNARYDELLPKLIDCVYTKLRERIGVVKAKAATVKAVFDYIGWPSTELKEAARSYSDAAFLRSKLRLNGLSLETSMQEKLAYWDDEELGYVPDYIDQSIKVDRYLDIYS